MTLPVHVAVAVIVNAKQEVLLALRHAHQHQGNLWEFPGGKVDSNESVYDALLREIVEELDVVITSAQPLLEVTHKYNDKSVLLDVWLVDKFEGSPKGKEGQQLRWCPIVALNVADFPAANVPIITRLQSN
ncbi:MAG: 8-oxo-dGTP diphosphatase MutT [Piscirickettsiaceae bacterium]|nr:8-oxo-dGTP diphosphatase MutT [Piscirickettsiaceae bacterium]